MSFSGISPGALTFSGQPTIGGGVVATQPTSFSAPPVIAGTSSTSSGSGVTDLGLSRGTNDSSLFSGTTTPTSSPIALGSELVGFGFPSGGSGGGGGRSSPFADTGETIGAAPDFPFGTILIGAALLFVLWWALKRFKPAWAARIARVGHARPAAPGAGGSSLSQ